MSITYRNRKLEEINSKAQQKIYDSIWKIWVTKLLSLTIFLLNLRKVLAVHPIMTPPFSPTSLLFFRCDFACPPPTVWFLSISPASTDFWSWWPKIIAEMEHLRCFFSTLQLSTQAIRFDDFSTGCGACGKAAHVYKDCPHKNAPTPTLKLTIKKPSYKEKPAGDLNTSSSINGEWNQVGKDNKTTKSGPNYISPSTNIYLSERGGVNIIYESDDSKKGIQCLLQDEEVFIPNPNLIAVAGFISSLVIDHNSSTIRMNSLPYSETGPDSLAKNDENHLTSKTMENGPDKTTGCGNNLHVEKVNNDEQDKATSEETHSEKAVALETMEVATNDNHSEDKSLGNQHQQTIEDLEYFDDEQLGYEYEDLIIEDPKDMNTTSSSIPKFPIEDMSAFLISEDPPFTK